MAIIYDKLSTCSPQVTNVPGPQGEKGDPGEDGSPGLAGGGAPGSTWNVDEGVPSDVLGVDGDFYLNSLTGDVYQKTTGNYLLVANIKMASDGDFDAVAIYNFKTAINPQSGTTYTVLATDLGKAIKFTNGSAINFTVSTVLPDQGSLVVIQGGAGQVTVVPTGLTIRSFSGFTKTAGQYAVLTLLRDGTDLYLFGEGTT